MTILALSFAAYLFALWKRPLLYLGLVLQVAYMFSRGAELGNCLFVMPRGKDFEAIKAKLAGLTEHV